MEMLVTAGPTREFLDPVRFLSNRLTGKMGYAIAAAAVRRGHAVHLVSGPVALPPPAGVRLTPVVSAADMLAAVRAGLPACDALVMCAAVADWRPRQTAAAKLKKTGQPATLELEPTADILMDVRTRRRPDQCVIGFAAETDDVLAHAQAKLARKGLDLIVANDVSRADAGFAVDTNVVTLVTRDNLTPLPLMAKTAVAERIVAWAEDWLSGAGSPPHPTR